MVVGPSFNFCSICALILDVALPSALFMDKALEVGIMVRWRWRDVCVKRQSPRLFMLHGVSVAVRRGSLFFFQLRRYSLAGFGNEFRVTTSR